MNFKFNIYKDEDWDLTQTACHKSISILFGKHGFQVWKYDKGVVFSFGVYRYCLELYLTAGES